MHGIREHGTRELEYAMMRRAGAPERIVRTYMKYQEGLKTRNTIGGALGERYGTRVGIPQGDPFSMMIAAMVMRPWADRMRKRAHTIPLCG